MHYRNGREAKNGDKVIQLGSYGADGATIKAVGILYDAVPGNDFCNGKIASIIGAGTTGACLCDCVHEEDLATVLIEKGLNKRPQTK